MSFHQREGSHPNSTLVYGGDLEPGTLTLKGRLGVGTHLQQTVTRLPFLSFLPHQPLSSNLRTLTRSCGHPVPRTLPAPLSSEPLTCFRERRAHSSRISAASSFPWRLYRVPRFLRVVFTVGLRGEITKGRMGSEQATEEREQGKVWVKGRLDPDLDECFLGSQLTCSLCRPCTSLRTQHRVRRPHGAGSAWRGSPG